MVFNWFFVSGVLNNTWNSLLIQPVLSNNGKACSKNQWDPLMGFELTSNRYSQVILSQRR